MRKLTVALLGAAATLGFAMPAVAHESNWQTRHDWQHDQLDDWHDDVHDQLDEEHARAHEEGLSPWEHRRLHEELDYQHARADYQIQREHRREHRRDRWQRYNPYYDNYGY